MLPFFLRNNALVLYVLQDLLFPDHFLLHVATLNSLPLSVLNPSLPLSI